MDDRFLAADDEAQATTLLRLFGDSLAAIGLRVNPRKSHAIGWSPHEPVPDGMQRVALTEAAREAAPSALPGTRVLGVPLGTDAYIHDEVSKIVDDAERDASLAWYLGSRQAAFLLLRTCVAAQVRYPVAGGSSCRTLAASTGSCGSTDCFSRESRRTPRGRRWRRSRTDDSW